MFYKTVVQAVLLFGSEMWVMTPRIIRTLGVIFHWVDQQMVGKNAEEHGQDLSVSPSGCSDGRGRLEEVETYVALCQNKITQSITTYPIMDLCLKAE